MTTKQKDIILHNIVYDDGFASSVTCFINGTPYVATKDHPRFIAILDYIEDSQEREFDMEAERLVGLFDLAEGISTQINKTDIFQRMTDRISANNGRLFLDGDPLDGVLADTIIKFMGSQTDFMPLANFLEKVTLNPNEHSREHLYRWLEKHDFALTPDGDIIAYKGIRYDDHSSSSGKAMVNGLVIEGRIPNKQGTTIEMPRSQVTFDPRNGCSTGLHVGNWRYARSFSDKTIRVKVNPRDVVSVPTDSNDEKMRVCRYRVLDEVTQEQRDIFYDPAALNATVRLAEEEREKANARVVKPRSPRKTNNTATKDGAKSKRQKALKTKAVKMKDKQMATVKEKITYPKTYEEFEGYHWNALPDTERRWVMKEWGISPLPKIKQLQIAALVGMAEERKATWPAT